MHRSRPVLQPNVRLIAASTFACSILLSTHLLLDTTGWSPPYRDAGTSPPCLASELTWISESGSPLDASKPIAMTSNRVIAACAPYDGTLRFSFFGTSARGIGSRTLVYANHERLLELELRHEDHSSAASIAAGDFVFVAFVNDEYEPPEDRNVWLSGLAFTP
jgi:hypothetical protein